MSLLKTFFQDDWHFFRYQIAKQTNGFLAFLRRVPLLNRLVTEKIFGAYGFKYVLSVIFTGGSWLFSFVKKGLYLLFISLYYNVILSLASVPGRDFSLNESLWLWFLLVVAGYGAIFQLPAQIASGEQEFFINFAVPGKRFVLGQKFVYVLKQMVFYLPASLILGLVYHYPLTTVGFVVGSYLLGNVLFMILSRYLVLHRVSKRVKKCFYWLYGITIVGLLAASIFFPIAKAVMPLVLQPICLVLIGAAGCLGLRFIWKYPQNEAYITELLLRSNEIFAKVTVNQKQSNEYIGQGLRMQKQMRLDPKENLEHLQGSNYLNALLFSRYKGALTARLKRCIYGIGLGIAAVGILGVLNLLTSFTEKDVTEFLPFLFFLMYFTSFGKTIVQMLFVNCDASMLYYPFYREGKTILQGFSYRLRRTFYYNFLLVAGLFLIFLTMNVTNHFFLSLQFFMVLLLLLVSLAFLFSFHELFIYYLLQPFTADMEVTNPLYKVISGVFYWLAYMSIQIHTSSFTYAILVSVVSLVYVAVGLVVIYRVAPRTFRIKN